MARSSAVQALCSFMVRQKAVNVAVVSTGTPMPSGLPPSLQEEDSSMSGFHTPSSRPVSRMPSATSSDAFFDSSSQLTSRSASVTSSAPGSAAVTLLNSMASSRRPLPGTRQSTRDLIGSLRQQAGLPPPDAFLSPPEDQEKTVVLPEPPQEARAVSNATASFRSTVPQSELQPVVLMQQMPVIAVAETGGQAVRGAEPGSDQVSASLCSYSILW